MANVATDGTTTTTTTPITISKAIHFIQTSLLDLPSCTQDHLFAAASLLSHSDYADVVTERAIANICGYPLCSNPLPLDRPRKGKYRISLREHRVYDLRETYSFCSDACLVNSKAFKGTLANERCKDLSGRRIDEALKAFEAGKVVDCGKREGLLREDNGDLGFSKLTIREKSDEVKGELVSLEEWIGPSNAIEGYVPQKEMVQGVHYLQGIKPKSKDSKPKHGKIEQDRGGSRTEVEFTSDVFVGDPFHDSKKNALSTTSLPVRKPETSKVEGINFASRLLIEEPSSNEDNQLWPDADDTVVHECNGSEDVNQINKGKTLKSSLKQKGAKRRNHNVKWVDEKEEKALIATEVITEENKSSQILNTLSDEDSARFVSAEVCAAALLQASEAISSGKLETKDAVSEAGLLIVPQHHADGEVETEINEDNLDSERIVEKWPKKTVLLDTDAFVVEDSWQDAPPEGFSLTLSTFATMWMALFGWITCSSLAFIYDRDENSRDEFLSVNGRDYPHRIVLCDGRSHEIKQTLAGCIGRALPRLVSELRLSTPVSIIERSMTQLLDTMSFVDALPPFKTKEWHVIVLLFIDVLSSRRLPGLAKHVADKRSLVHKVLGAANISEEEYETMKDLMIPLGKLSQI